MKFIRQGQWYEISECGNYTVCAAKVGGKYMFTATYKTKEINPQQILCVSIDPVECRHYCAEHERKLHAAQ